MDCSELTEKCRGNTVLSCNMRLCCGIWDTEYAPQTSLRPVDAKFGIEMLASTGERIGVVGFEVEEDGAFFLAHSPQGRNHREISREARRELVCHSDFRRELVKAVINLAAQTGAPYVKGMSALGHFKVATGSITLEKGIAIMDDLYLGLGFQDCGDGFYYYML